MNALKLPYTCLYLLTDKWSTYVFRIRETWDLQDDEDIEVGFLACNAMWTCKQILAFRGNILSAL